MIYAEQKKEIQAFFKQLLQVLPLYIEEGHKRECFSEVENLTQMNLKIVIFKAVYLLQDISWNHWVYWIETNYKKINGHLFHFQHH